VTKTKIYSLAIFGIIGLLLFYGILIEPFRLEVRHLYIENDRLNKVLNNKTAIHLSDLHIGKIGKREKQVMQIVGELDPDFIFLTGDYINWKGNPATAITFFSKLKAYHGIWAVMGDYDYSNSRESCFFCHEQGSTLPTNKHYIKFLRNSLKPLYQQYDKIIIGGVDGNFNKEFLDDNGLFESKRVFPDILLSHNPLDFDKIDARHKTLVLSGDTHGGQIPLPAWLWKLLGYEKNAKYNHGLFKEGNKVMYVSRGIGTSHLPIRIMRRPEIVVIHF
jgi:predicted MPP superfamily phosphohydrolase